MKTPSIMDPRTQEPQFKAPHMKHHAPWRGIAALVALLAIIYTMTNSGGFHIIDEVSRFAVTESLALRGSVDTNAIAWTQWVNSPREAQGDFGPNGDVYSKKGPAQPFLTTIWYLLLLIPTRYLELPFLSEELASSFGMLQWTMLFSGWVTAITAALVWRTAVQLGYRERVGALMGLLFGLATIAWPYATYLLAEPLSGLFLLLCFYGLVRWRNGLGVHDEGRHTGGSGWLWVAGISAGFAVATTIVHILLVIVFCFLWLGIATQALRSGGSTRPIQFGGAIGSLVRWGLPILIPMLLTAGLMIAYNMIRFDLFWNTGYQIFDGEFFITPLRDGVWGLLISPYRSFFLHSPIFFASLIAFPFFYRRHRLEALTFLGISLVIVVLYGKWWMWWGGYAWGPRFLVPLAPFWILLLAPMIERWLPNTAAGQGQAQEAEEAQETEEAQEVKEPRLPIRSQSWVDRIAMIGVGTLALLSILVQMSAILVNFVNFETELRGIFPTDWLEPLKYGPPATSLADFLYSPVFGQWKLLFSNLIVNSDLAWLRADGKVIWSVLIVGGFGIVLLGTYFIQWWNRWEAGAISPERSGPMRGFPAWLSLMLALAVMVVWTNQVSSDPRYGTQDEEYRAILDKIELESSPDDAIITIAPYHYTVPMNWFQSTLPIYGYATDSMQYVEAQTLLTSVTEKHPRIWFVTGGVAPADPNNSVERWLAQGSYKADDQWYNDYRLVRYATVASAEQSQEMAVNALLSDTDNSLSIVKAAASVAAEAGQTLSVEIAFQVEEAGQHNLRWFVQLLNSGGEAVAITDSASQGGYRNFVDLPAAQPMTEKLGLQLPPNLPSGTYQLIAGLYNPEREGTRLVTKDGADHVLLREINIQ